MKVIVCLDDREGMMFNRRRQSRDRTVTEDMIRTADGVLAMSPYSESLFQNTEVERRVSDRFLDLTKEGDWCFVEDRELFPYRDRIKTVVVYHWNRHYPSDRRFDLDLEREGFCLKERIEFAGYSHEKITKERFEK